MLNLYIESQIGFIFIVIGSFGILFLFVLWIDKKLESISYKKREEVKERRINAMIKDCRVYRNGEWVLIDWETDETIKEIKVDLLIEHGITNKNLYKCLLQAKNKN